MKVIADIVANSNMWQKIATGKSMFYQVSYSTIKFI